MADSFFSLDGQQRRRALDDLDQTAMEYLQYFLGPTGIPDRLAAASQVVDAVSPASGMQRSMQAAGEGRYLDSAIEGIGVAAPAGIAAYLARAGKAAAPVVAGAADDAEAALRGLFGVDAAPENPTLTFYHGSPHNYAAERLVLMPDGSTQYIVGAPDQLPDIPEGATVLRDFPYGRVRLDKAKTGAGAQAYGPGYYVGDIAATATSYRNRFSPDSKLTAFGGQEYKSARDLAKEILANANLNPTEAEELLDPLSSAAFSVMRNNPLDASISDMRGTFSDRRSGELLDKAESLFRSAEPRIETSGRVYEVQVPAAAEDFIDYSLPFNEQSQKVQDFLSGLVDRGMYESTSRALSDAFTSGAGGKLIAEEAKKAGLAGNRFPAERFGSSNYVLINEDLINIVKKYGIAGAATVLGVSVADVEQALAASGADGTTFAKGGPVHGSSLDVDVFAFP
ncbi:hypothetical protein UFOVP330_76 [uncultured Caudovirales phage]|uniref:Uncharacterized protein n=1 Tax=uncultured Caudovirales phage TaxID=2100421 RepID=A0A6J5LVK3_9CAUD|nr:hypothetical protein UFOVP330_76 [uncultured Caudovirales phage]